MANSRPEPACDPGWDRPNALHLRHEKVTLKAVYPRLYPPRIGPYSTLDEPLLTLQQPLVRRVGATRTDLGPGCHCRAPFKSIRRHRAAKPGFAPVRHTGLK